MQLKAITGGKLIMKFLIFVSIVLVVRMVRINRMRETFKLSTIVGFQRNCTGFSFIN